MEPRKVRVELDREEDGRYIADVVDVPGVMAYGQSEAEALNHALALLFRVVADRIDNGETSVDSAGEESYSGGLVVDTRHA